MVGFCRVFRFFCRFFVVAAATFFFKQMIFPIFLKKDFPIFFLKSICFLFFNKYIFFLRKRWYDSSSRSHLPWEF